MNNLKTIDYISSVVAAFIWLAGGAFAFEFVGYIARLVRPGLQYYPHNSPIFPLLGLTAIICFILGAILTTKLILPLFLRFSKQGELKTTRRLFLIYSWFSLFALIPAVIFADESVVIGYLFWVMGLSFIYIRTRIKAQD